MPPLSAVSKELDMLYNNDCYFFACFDDTLFIQTNFTNSRTLNIGVTVSFSDMLFVPNAINLMPFIRSGVDTGWRLHAMTELFKNLVPQPPLEFFRHQPEKFIEDNFSMFSFFLDHLDALARKEKLRINIPIRKKKQLFAESLEWLRRNLETSTDDLKKNIHLEAKAPYLGINNNEIWFTERRISEIIDGEFDIYSDKTARPMILSLDVPLVGKSVFPLNQYACESMSEPRRVGSIDVLKAAMHLSKTPEEFHDRIKKVGLGRGMLVMKKATVITSMVGLAAEDALVGKRASELFVLYRKVVRRNEPKLVEALS